MEAVRTAAPPAIDGRLDDAAWTAATPATGFRQVDPDEGAPVTERTEVRILYDDQALYVAARLYDSGPVSSRLGRRDSYIPDSDWFGLALDSHHTHHTSFGFQVNPSGVRTDLILGDEFEDISWDPVWQAATRVDDEGWSAELRIPFSQLRFAEGGPQMWGIQSWRRIGRKQEMAYLSFTPRSERAGVARYGHLVALDGLRAGRRLEVLPYVAARSEFTEQAAGNPFRSGSDHFARTGLDLKYRMSSSLTLDATVNPDFGQVEVDPAVVNLTAFETFYEEKRPFFIEGAEIFQFGGGAAGGQLFYSRRIGAAPHVPVPGAAVFSSAPQSTSILGAAKVTGRTAGGWSLGLLNAVTRAERAHWMDEDGELRRSAVEPLANYFAGRVARDLRAGRTSVGLMATSVHRDLSDPALTGRMRTAAYTGGADFRHEWGGRSWGASGSVAFSAIRGDAPVITAAQRSSARYFQRPDAAHLELDPGATGMAGYAANVALNRIAGAHWRGSLTLDATSPGFEVNDLGYQRAADRVRAGVSATYLQNRGAGIVRRWSATGRALGAWNYGGDGLGTGLTLSGAVSFVNFWNVNARLQHTPEALDDRLTRGGPLALDPASTLLRLYFNGDPRRRVTWNSSLSGSRTPAGERRGSASASLGIRPTDHWSLSVGPRVSVVRVPAQFMGSRGDTLASSTFGRRYLFAPLEQVSVSLDTRLGITFTPRLTLELYMQPFIAAGDYGAPMEFAAPGSYRFLQYGSDAGSLRRGASCAAPDEPGTRWIVDPDAAGPASCFTVSDRDFTLRSLRGNAVLRWEWRPGSTLFLVWQQQRAARDDAGAMRLRHDAAELFSARPDNVFMLKVNYWLNP